MTTRAARLLFPPVRWSAEDGSYDAYRPAIEKGLELGVGGWIIFGGPADAVRDLTGELRERSRHPVLIGADLERGAGQQFPGATALPPPAVLAELDDLELTRRAGELTAREALAMGIDWVFAPVADLDLEPENPIVGSRAFGADPERASRHVVAWIEGCREAGALACAKHFPGHGRTTSDSHLALPTVDVGEDDLATDLRPFRAAIGAGVDSMMTAHVAYPALDPSGLPATLSRPILTGLLRERMGFVGLIVTDALNMKGVQGGGGEPEAAVRALAAGCDALLYVREPEQAAAALEAARGGELTEDRVTASLERIRAAAERLDERSSARAGGAGGEGTRPWGSDSDAAWALGLAGRAVAPLRGQPRCAGSVEVMTVDDDVGGPFPPGSRAAFPEALRGAGVHVREVGRPTGGVPVIIALYADIKGFKGRPGLSAEAVETVAAAVVEPRGATVVLFGHPRMATETPGPHLLGAWGGEAIMQRAAARWLAANPDPTEPSPR
ncbi:MAG TPA: glycoside hydrolase family 3 N-terminal domain-containing protein [Longimicrobiales bacterium]|nr:glycoside hydrolase family 3 N-terminal domain-containing protein [Longimicrobiales bacterium]